MRGEYSRYMSFPNSQIMTREQHDDFHNEDTNKKWPTREQRQLERERDELKQEVERLQAKIDEVKKIINYEASMTTQLETQKEVHYWAVIMNISSKLAEAGK